MQKLLAFTDIHMKSEGQKIIGLDPFAQFERALAHGLRHHPEAERIILMGDLADTGAPEEYDRVQEILQDIETPVTLMAGNHDVRDTLVQKMPQAVCDAAGFLQTSHSYGTVRVLTLDTLFGPPAVSYAHFGAYCDQRFAWLTEQLSEAKQAGQWVALFSHHPPFRVGFKGMDQIRMRDDARMLKVLKGSGVSVHLICGHIHRTISGNWDGFGFSMLKSTCHQMPLAIDTTEMTLGTTEPAAYGVILLTDDGIIVHSEDFDLVQETLNTHTETPVA
ncbi:metallophosphoesterase [Neptunicoccus cionae]|uniref:3',5'-cyclic adenosine monophosphate phosphodiesterase CpdA n=1 Tax=Neptunicoccus cionae TaxID=2035344 RepID=A0A916VNJ1_9RHOB|nr:metallophosphoesterase [Amylibacter cionae]GGA13465.1 3',5'-cyclic adenosine monophosphate phosphodiesterase CpdA [Amylibacter cionae]